MNVHFIGGWNSSQLLWLTDISQRHLYEATWPRLRHSKCSTGTVLSGAQACYLYTICDVVIYVKDFHQVTIKVFTCLNPSKAQWWNK